MDVVTDIINLVTAAIGLATAIGAAWAVRRTRRRRSRSMENGGERHGS